jgi:hypothetical protein
MDHDLRAIRGRISKSRIPGNEIGEPHAIVVDAVPELSHGVVAVNSRCAKGGHAKGARSSS